MKSVIVTKRVLAFLFVLAISVPLLFAERLKVTSVQLGMSNDVWSNGLSRNDDDQDSFALFFTLDTNYGWLRIDSHAITNRGWRDGWEPGDPESQGIGALYRGRYDDLEILLGHTFNAKLSGESGFSLTAEAGASALGRLGQDLLQNGLHLIAGIHGVELPYDIETPLVRPALNLEGTYTRHLMNIGNGSLSARLKANMYASFSLFYQERANASLALEGESGDNGYVYLGYSTTQVTSGLRTQDLLGRYMNSIEFGFGFQAGAVRIDYQSFPTTDYGLTRLTIDAMKIRSWGMRKSSGRTDIPKAFAAYSFTPTINFVSVGFELPIEGKENWSLIAIDHYTAGTPLSKEEEKNSNVFSDPRKKINDAYLTAGVKYVFHLNFMNLLDPFVYCAGGLAFLRYDELTNMIEGATDPSYTWHNIRPCLNIGAGLQTKTLKIPYVPLPPIGFFIAAGAVVTPGVTKQTPTGVNLNRSFFQPYVDIGVSVNLDV